MTGKNSTRVKLNLKARYDELKAAGICVTCGKHKAITDQIRCTYCKKKREDSNRRSYLNKVKKEGLKKSVANQLQKGFGQLLFPDAK
jgi:hypothetical protein